MKCDHDVVVNEHQRPFGAFESPLNGYEALQGLRWLSLTFSVRRGLQLLGRFNRTVDVLISDGESPTFLASGNGRGGNDLVPRGWYPEAVRFEAERNPEDELEVCEAENNFRVTSTYVLLGNSVADSDDELLAASFGGQTASDLEGVHEIGGL